MPFSRSSSSNVCVQGGVGESGIRMEKGKGRWLGEINKSSAQIKHLLRFSPCQLVALLCFSRPQREFNRIMRQGWADGEKGDLCKVLPLCATAILETLCTATQHEPNCRDFRLMATFHTPIHRIVGRGGPPPKFCYAKNKLRQFMIIQRQLGQFREVHRGEPSSRQTQLDSAQVIWTQLNWQLASKGLGICSQHTLNLLLTPTRSATNARHRVQIYSEADVQQKGWFWLPSSLPLTHWLPLNPTTHITRISKC